MPEDGLCEAEPDAVDPLLSYWIAGASSIGFPVFGVEVFRTFGFVGLVFMLIHTFNYVLGFFFCTQKGVLVGIGGSINYYTGSANPQATKNGACDEVNYYLRCDTVRVREFKVYFSSIFGRGASGDEAQWLYIKTYL